MLSDELKQKRKRIVEGIEKDLGVKGKLISYAKYVRETGLDKDEVSLAVRLAGLARKVMRHNQDCRPKKNNFYKRKNIIYDSNGRIVN
jgi:hypothetical protein